MIPDWRPGESIDLSTRKKVIFAHGLGSETGAATFGPIQAELAGLGFGPGDFLEVSPVSSGGVPRPYRVEELRGPLESTTAGVADSLRWYAERLPATQELHLIGYSLGGLLLVRAVTRLLVDDPMTLAGRVRTILTLNSPLAGIPPDTPGFVGLLSNAGRLLPEFESLLEPVVRDLLREGRDPAAAAERDIAYRVLSASGVRVIVIGSLDDLVVAPARVSPDVPNIERIEIVNETRIRPTLQVDRLFDRLWRAGQQHGLPIPGLERAGTRSFWLGHSAILADAAALLAVWQEIGFQEPATP